VIPKKSSSSSRGFGGDVLVPAGGVLEVIDCVTSRT
jgi:hypothetical protein